MMWAKDTARTSGARNAGMVLLVPILALVAALVALIWVCGITAVIAGAALGAFASLMHSVLKHRTVYRYVRLDTCDRKPHTIQHILHEEFRQRTKSSHMVLEHSRSHKFYVVERTAWLSKYFEPGETEQSAFYKTTEKFSTLEQAMLYFEMVKS